MLIKFPSTLPAPLISSNSIQHNPTFSRAKMTSGRSRQRKQHHTSTANTTFRFIMTSEQVLIFEEWFASEINNGAEWFEIRRLTANGYEPLKSRFKSMYKGANYVADNMWSIEFDAEVYTYTIDGDWWLFDDWFIGECGNEMDTLCIIDCVVNEEWPLYE